MHEIRFPLGLHPAGGTYCAPQALYLYLRGPTSKGREREEREGAGPQIFWPRTAPAAKPLQSTFQQGNLTLESHLEYTLCPKNTSTFYFFE